MIDADSPIDREYLSTYSKHSGKPARSTATGAHENESNQTS